MRLRDLLDEPDLALRVVVGDDEALEETVRWTYSSDLMNPSRYLFGGELVITGLVWRRHPADSEEFVSNVAGAGALAIAAGEAQFGAIPDDVVVACRRHGVVLLAVPEHVSFSALTEHIIGSSATERGARLEATLGRHRRLLSSLAQGERLDDLTRRVGQEVDAECRVITTMGRHVVQGPDPLSSDVLDRLTGAFLSADRFPVVVADGGDGLPYSLFPIGAALGSRLTMWMIVAQTDVRDNASVVTDALSELAAIAQLERTRIEERRRIVRPIADDAMRLVVSGATNQPETLVRLHQAGLELDEPGLVTVAVFGFVTPDNLDEERAIVEDAVAELDGSVVAQAPDAGMVAIVPTGADDAQVSVLRTALGRISPGLHRRRFAVGLSEAAPVAGLAGMLEEARHAHHLATLGEDPVSVVAGGEIDSHVLLLATVPDDIRRLFSLRVLGRVLEYDESHDAGLCETLEAFLACSGSWNRTAKRLHLHVNSVRYRISRVEELSGRNLSDLEDRVDVFLALRSL